MSQSEPVPRIARFDEAPDILAALNEYREVLVIAHQDMGLQPRQAHAAGVLYERTGGTMFFDEALAVATMRNRIFEHATADGFSEREVHDMWDQLKRNSAEELVDEARYMAILHGLEAQFPAVTSDSEADRL